MPHTPSADGLVLPGARIGAYRLDRALGRGGSGIVYRAEHADGRVVALKLLKPELLRSDEQVRRFHREVRIAQLVAHRHVVRVIEAGDHEGSQFLVTDYWERGALTGAIAGNGLDLEDCARVASHVASGLACLHELGIVHRDVKPGNVLLRSDGTAALADFGLATGRAFTSLTAADQVLGTPAYIAPETLEGRASTAQADIYSFGCLMYECVTGRPPFDKRRLLELAVAHLTEEPLDPRELRDGISGELAWALVQALAKDPAARPPSAMAYARLLMVAIASGSPRPRST